MSKVKILGVCGSPRKGGNSEQVTNSALESARNVNDVETELVTLAGLKINHCIGCARCSGEESTIENPCPAFNDSMTDLYSKVTSADGYIFTSPVYVGDVNSLMKAFLDRLLPFTTAYYYPDTKAQFKETLRYKPLGAIAVGGGRNDGMESILHTFYR